MRRARPLHRTLAACALAAALLCALLASATSGDVNESPVRPQQNAAITAGSFHACALTATGAVRCWGRNTQGQLGDGAALPGADAPSPSTPVLLGQPARAVAAGAEHTCAVLADGAVRCWGDGFSGQLGNGATGLAADSSAPAPPVALGGPAVAVTAGDGHTCALLADGAVRCWGRNDTGQLGNGATLPADGSATPAQPVALGQPARAVAAGGFHTCAILADGSVRCWGADTDGQLGDGAPEAGSSAPVAVSLGQPATALTAGTNFTCALLADGSVRCWGNDAMGQLGDGGAIPGADWMIPAPPVALGGPAQAITAGAGHVCALLGGTVRCWGADNAGQLGDGGAIPGASTAAPAAPVVPGASPPRAITAGAISTCSLRANGQVRCWGSDGDGQLGDGEPLTSAAAPQSAVDLPALGPADSADLSLAVQASAPTATVGDPVTVTVTLANAGADAAVATVAASLGPRLALTTATPSLGAYDAATGTWSVGAIAPGTSATLTLATQAVAPGAAAPGAEVIAASAQDPDSTPGNGAAGEDDRAGAALTVSAPPTAPTTPTTPTAPETPAAPRAAADALVLTLRPARDRSAPFAFTARGRLVVTRAALRGACSGTVTVTARAGRRAVRTRRAALRLRGGDCAYSARLVFRSPPWGAKRLRITARFGGNAAVLTKVSPARTARLG
jgi:alpha-tubulin suppressor-like RCC1 family protein